MPNVIPDYIKQKTAREKLELDRLAAEDDSWMAQQQKPPAPQAVAMPPVGSPAVKPKVTPDTGIVTEGVKAIAGGALDAAQGVFSLGFDAAKWLDENLLDVRADAARHAMVAPNLLAGTAIDPKGALENHTTAGKIVRTLAQVAIPFAGGLRALQGVKMVNSAVKAPAVGAAVDFSVLDPDEKHVSDVVRQLAGTDSVFDNAVTQYLSSNSGDSHMESRFKNTVEGLGLGLAAEGVFKSIKAVRGHFLEKGMNPAAAVEQGAKAFQQDSLHEAAHSEPSVLDKVNEVTGVYSQATPTARREKAGDVFHTFYSSPENSAQLDAWQKAADVAAEGKAPAGKEGKTRYTGELPIIGKPDDPMVKDLGTSFSDAMESTKRAIAENTPAFARTSEQVHAINAYSRLQDATIEALRDAANAAQKGGRLLSPQEQKALQELNKLDIVVPQGYGKAVLSDAERVTVREGTTATTQKIAEKQKLIEAIAPVVGKAPAKEAQTESSSFLKLWDNQEKPVGLRDEITVINHETGESVSGAVSKIGDGSLIIKSDRNSKPIKVTPEKYSLEQHDAHLGEGAVQFAKDSSGHIEPGELIAAGTHASKQGIVTGAATGAASLAGSAQADDGTVEDPVTKYANAAVFAMAGYAGWRVVKHFGATKAAAKEADAVAKGTPRSIIEAAKPGSAPVSKFASIDPNPAALKKKTPTIPRESVARMVEQAVSGDYRGAADGVLKGDFNMDHIDSPEEVKELIEGFSNEFAKGVDQATHGKQSFAQIEELALELGSSPTALKAMYQGTDNLAAKVLAHRTLMAASAEKVAGLARAVNAGGDTSDAIIALNKQVTLHAAIQSQMKGIQTEIARSLSAFRITATTANLSAMEKDALITNLGGRKANMELARQLDDIAGDTILMNSLIRRTPMGKTSDALFEMRTLGLLSAPATHAVNVVGNTMTAVMSVAERQTATLMGRFRKVPPGQAVEQAEVKAYVLGMYSGLRDAVRLTSIGKSAVVDASKKFVTGDREGAVGILRDNSSEMGGAWESFFSNAPVLDNAAYGTREYNGNIPAISSQSLELDPTQFIGKFTDYLGAIVGAPGRMLTTSDELFKTVFHRGELAAQAYRMARTEGHEGDALISRMSSLVEDPTPELRSHALGAARYGTFTSPLGNMGRPAQELIRNVPGMRWLFPFVRTPMNIAKYVVQHTPLLNLKSEHISAELAAGGARRDIALAKTVVGGGLYALGAGLAAEGYLTGGGEFNNTAEKMNGWRPYSLKVGGEYYELNRLDPIGAFLFLSADFAHISGHLDDTDAGDLASAMVLSIQRNIASKTYLKGVTDLVSAVNDEARGRQGAMKNYLRNFASSFTPFSGMSNAVRKETDPEIKEVMTLIDSFKARIPGVSKDVHPTVNLFGEDQHYDVGVGPDILSPIATSTASLDEAANEIARLNIDLKKPSPKIAVPNTKESIDLTPDQFYKLQKYSGEWFKGAVTDLVSSARYKELKEEDSNIGYTNSKQLNIQLIAAKAGEVGRAKLFAEYPQLTQQYRDLLNNTGLALRGEKVLPITPQMATSPMKHPTPNIPFM